MKLKITLSTESIEHAIGRLMEAQDNLEYGLQQTIDMLTAEGADVAQGSYGGMASVDSESVGFHGVIRASGEAVPFAEFGAGDATIPVMFENYPGFDVYPGAYSEQVGSGEYAMTGRWHFGGNVYTEVEPRGGLYNAKEHIKDNYKAIARGAIQL